MVATLCLFTCLSQKNLGDKLKMGLTLLKGDRKGAAMQSNVAATRGD